MPVVTISNQVRPFAALYVMASFQSDIFCSSNCVFRRCQIALGWQPLRILDDVSGYQIILEQILPSHIHRLGSLYLVHLGEIIDGLRLVNDNAITSGLFGSIHGLVCCPQQLTFNGSMFRSLCDADG